MKVTCKDIQSRILNDINKYIHICEMYGLRVPHLTTIQVGNDEVSKKYIKNKKALCNKVGIVNTHYDILSESGDMVLSLIDLLEKDKRVDGIMVQLPIKLEYGEYMNTPYISLLKDVDGLSADSYNSYFHLNERTNIPCTARGVLDILRYNNVKVEGKTVLVIGKGATSGHPISLLLQKMGATVINANSRTTKEKLDNFLKGVDIVISCSGVAGIINKDNLGGNYEAIINVGMTTNEEGKLIGDLDYTDLDLPNTLIPPLVGGTGILTVTNLLLNTVFAHYKNVQDIFKTDMEFFIPCNKKLFDIISKLK